MCNIHFCNECIGMGTLVYDLYVLEIHESMRNGNTCVTTMSSGKRSYNVSVDLKHLWHLKLSHINEKRIGKLAKRTFNDPTGSELSLTCEPFLLAILAKQPFVHQSGRANELLELIYIDMSKAFFV